MRRILFLFCGAVAVGLMLAAAAHAQGVVMPEYPLNGHKIDRGPGGYASLIKILLCLVPFWAWVKTTEWVNRDTRRVRLSYGIWNMIVFIPFVLGFLLCWTIPWFWLGYLLLLICYGAPLGAYVYQRNARVEAHEKVLTPDHFRHLLKQKTGVKVTEGKKHAADAGPPVEMKALGGESDQQNTANLLLARQSSGFVTVKELIAEAVQRRGERVMLDSSGEAVAVRYQIDGVWHDVEPLSRAAGDAAIHVAKTLSNLNSDERAERQAGHFSAALEGKKFTCNVLCQGTKNGERAVIHLWDPHVEFKEFDELGMRDKLVESLRAALAAKHGFVVFSAMPQGGLTTTVTVALRTMDRYMRDFVAVEDPAAPEPAVENVEIVPCDIAGGESPSKLLPKLIRKDPNVIVMRDLVDAETVRMLCEEAADERLIVGTIRSKDAAEALLRVLMLKVPATQFAPVATAVVGQRLIRKLCEACKEEYTPNPELIQKLGLPAGRVETLYREPQPQPQPQKGKADKPCPECRGIGYQGRTSIYEVIIVDDGVRQALLKQPKLEVVRQMARKAGMRTLQEEGILLVAKGVTSLTELQRVLKQ